MGQSGWKSGPSPCYPRGNFFCFVASGHARESGSAPPFFPSFNSQDSAVAGRRGSGKMHVGLGGRGNLNLSYLQHTSQCEFQLTWLVLGLGDFLSTLLDGRQGSGKVAVVQVRDSFPAPTPPLHLEFSSPIQVPTTHHRFAPSICTTVQVTIAQQCQPQSLISRMGE